MKRNTLLSVILIWLIAGLSIFSFSSKATAMPLPIYKLYLPIIHGAYTPPTIVKFDQNEVIIHFKDVPKEYEGSDGLIWISGVAGNNFLQEIELNWVTKIGTLGIWRGIIPPVPYTAWYYLKNGLIFYNGYGNPAYIRDSDYMVLYH